MLYRLLTGIADHFEVSDLHVPVLFILFRYAAVLDGLLCVFLHVVQFRVRYDAGRSYRVAHMFSKSDFRAPHLPSAAVSPLEQKFPSAITFHQAAGDIPSIAFILGKSERTKTKNRAQKQIEFHKSPFGFVQV